MFFAEIEDLRHINKAVTYTICHIERSSIEIRALKFFTKVSRGRNAVCNAHNETAQQRAEAG